MSLLPIPVAFSYSLISLTAQRTLPVLYPEPKTLTQKVGNIEMALQAFKEDGVELPGVYANGEIMLLNTI